MARMVHIVRVLLTYGHGLLYLIQCLSSLLTTTTNCKTVHEWFGAQAQSILMWMWTNSGKDSYCRLKITDPTESEWIISTPVYSVLHSNPLRHLSFHHYEFIFNVNIFIRCGHIYINVYCAALSRQCVSGKTVHSQKWMRLPEHGWHVLLRKSKDYVYGIWVHKVLGRKGYYRVKITSFMHETENRGKK